MATKKLLPFNLTAMVRLTTEFPFLVQHYKSLGYNTDFLFDGKIQKLADVSVQINGRASQAFRNVFRNHVEGKPVEKRYLELVAKVKNLQAEELTEEFSLEIKAKGTKKEIIDDLNFIISKIKNTSLQEIKEEEEWVGDVTKIKTSK